VDSATLVWPFFTDAHRKLAASLEEWAEREITEGIAGAERQLDGQKGGSVTGTGDVDAACRSVVRKLGKAGWLRYTVPAAYGGAHDQLDVRSLCIARETLARISGLADVSFAMQGLGSGPITLFGSRALKERYLRRVGRGEAIAAFAISETNAGSDIAAMETSARRDGNDYVIDGEKTWISNGGIADFYVVFCRLASDEARSAGRRKPKDLGMRAAAERGAASRPQFIAIVVEPDDSGFSVAERIETIAPHPLARIRFDNCRVPADRVVGEPEHRQERLRHQVDRRQDVPGRGRHQCEPPPGQVPIGPA